MNGVILFFGSLMLLSLLAEFHPSVSGEGVFGFIFIMFLTMVIFAVV